MSEKSRRLASLANVITALRIALAPVVVLLLLHRGESLFNIYNTLVAGVVFVVAALTDRVDGYCARKYDAVTKLGQFLDPLADKTLMISAMIALWYVGHVNHVALFPFWALLVVVSREMLISSFRIIGTRKGTSFPASWTGKIKMFSQTVVVCALIFFPRAASGAPETVLLYVMAALTVYSGIDYIMRARREIFATNN